MLNGTYLVLLSLLILISFDETRGQSITDIISCPPLSMTPIMGNPAALEELRQWCASDSRCSVQYGQSIIANPEIFNLLFQTTTDSFSGTLYLESPLIEKICYNNMTWLDVNILIWKLILRLDILERGRSCNEGETPDVVDSVTGEIICNDLPWNQQTSTSGFNALGLGIEIAIFVVVVIVIVLQIWTFIRRGNVKVL